MNRADHSTRFVRDALLGELSRLRALLPDTEYIRRNVASIEKHAPVENMDESKLRDYVNLMHRTVAVKEEQRNG